MRVVFDGLQRRSSEPLDLRRQRMAQRAPRAKAPVAAKEPPVEVKEPPVEVKPAAPTAATTAPEPQPQIQPWTPPRRRLQNWRRVTVAVLVLLVAGGGVAYEYRHGGAHATVRTDAAAATHAAHAATHAPAPTPAATTNPTSAQLQAIVNNAAASAGVPTGIVVTDLANGATASSGADTIFVSASIYKLYVADMIYHQLDAGQLQLSATAGDTGLTVSQCLNYMITVSSNPCGEALGAIAGWDSANPALHAAGFVHTTLSLGSDEKTSASDVALLLQKLYDGQLVSANSTAAFIGLLKAQQINNRLPAGLPAGTVIAHKTGDLNGLVHDAGIIYTAHGNYIVVGMTGPWPVWGNAPPWFASLSSKLYAAVTKSS